MTELTQTKAPASQRGPRGGYPRPNAWQLTAPPDSRWGSVQYQPAVAGRHCRYCGDGYYNQGRDCPRALCLACGTPQCRNSGECLVCFIGFVGTVPSGQSGSCGYAGCGKPAVARAARVRQVCAFHLGKARSRGRTLDEQIADSLRRRDLGGLDWQKLTWFGPELRYAVRRWHDDGRTGWTTGADPKGFETAGQADREAAAWNDPRGSDGWHAVRVTLSPQLRDDIRAWQDRPKTARMPC